MSGFELHQHQQPFLDALRNHHVEAKVMHLDHYRVKGGVAVRTDYIISVEAATATALPETSFFLLSKTFSSFRQLAHQLEKAADFLKSGGSKNKKNRNEMDGGGTTNNSSKVMEYCHFICHLVESEKVSRLGKVNYHHVKQLAQQRSEIINSILQIMCQQLYYYNSSSTTTTTMDQEEIHPALLHIYHIIETFLLTDHCSIQETAAYHQKTGSNNNNSNNNTIHDNPIFNPLAGIIAILDPIKQQQHKQHPQQQQQQQAHCEQQHNHNNQAKTTTATTAATKTTTATVPKSVPEVNPSHTSSASVVIPLTRKDRRSQVTRAMDAQELEQTSKAEVGLLVDDDDDDDNNIIPTATTLPIMTTTTSSSSSLLWTVQNPWLWFAFMGTVLVILARASSIRIQLDADWGFLLLFASYCLGLHTPTRTSAAAAPGAAATTISAPMVVRDRSGRRLIRRTLIRTKKPGVKHQQQKQRSGIEPVLSSNQQQGTVAAATATKKPEFVETKPQSTTPVVTDDESLEDEQEGSLEEEEGFPMSEYPEGAELGSVLNCWGRSAAADFKIRGPNYLNDKKKVPSQEFLFPIRGVDLFLTDTCPDHVGRNPSLLRGKLRQEPTFLVNFRLPWGVLVLYFSIPPKFLPYLQAGYQSVSPEQLSKLQQGLHHMTNGERCVCRFLMNDTAHKNKTFKIVPVVVKGPWVVRQVVGGKPALIGNKLPIQYFYQPSSGDQALYWEADLDIAASSAARGILSVARTYTQQLTVDLGFVVQGNAQDELPERMLVGCRLHGVDPLTAPSYPPMPHDLSQHMMTTPTSAPSSDDGSVTPTTAQ